MARFLVRREKQRTEPDAAGFPLQMFAELRRCVGLKTKNKGRKPLKSRKYFFLSPCGPKETKVRVQELRD